MAKYDIEHTCGHTETHQLIGPRRDRERRIEWLETTLCSECYQEELARQRDEATEAARQEAAEQELPELSGSEKQVAWAVRIRGGMLKSFESILSDASNVKNTAAFFDWLYGHTAASWWIDNRSASTHDIFGRFKDTLPKNDIDAIDEAAIKAESTLRPETAVVEMPAEVKIADSTVRVRLPARDDRFREIVRAAGFSWGNDAWERAFNPAKTDVRDRAAEIASRLLAGGFVVQITDDVIREKTASGSYAPEKTRCVAKLASGKHNGWFAISWARSEDFYKAARKIAGSRYDKPFVVVPPTSFDEVVDFAQMYDFGLTAGAQAVVDEQKRIREDSLVVSPKIKDVAKVTQLTKPGLLKIEETDVLDEFKD